MNYSLDTSDNVDNIKNLKDILDMLREKNLNAHRTPAPEKLNELDSNNDNSLSSLPISAISSKVKHYTSNSITIYIPLYIDEKLNKNLCTLLQMCKYKQSINHSRGWFDGKLEYKYIQPKYDAEEQFNHRAEFDNGMVDEYKLRKKEIISATITIEFEDKVPNLQEFEEKFNQAKELRKQSSRWYRCC